MQYVILDDQKRATHSFKNGGKTKEEVQGFDNIGLIVPKPIIILDFDTKQDAEIMLKIVEGLDLKCRVMKTTRGYHFWFKSEEPWKCFKKTRLACGIFSDCKSHSKNAYVKIRDNGVDREWIRKCPGKEIEEVPDWLRPISTPTDKFNFKGMKDGDGRNQELFNYIVYLQSKGFKKQVVIDTIQTINQFVFEYPLSDEEISTICRDDAFKSDEEMDKQIKEQTVGKFSHSEFGDKLIEEYRIITVGTQIYIYEDGYYQKDNRSIERKMIEMFKDIKTQQRSEVLNYVRIQTALERNSIPLEPYIINLKNTRLDIRTSSLLPFTHEAIEFDRIPVAYDPTAYSPDLDKMLNRVFMGDREVVDLFGEMVGYCLMKHCEYASAFIFYGSGSNGKSTILDLIKKFLGQANYSTIELDKLTEKFNTAELENMLANIGDDINNTVIRDTGTIKNLISGNGVMAQRKGERPFNLKAYAKHIYSCNEMPHSFDKTEGMYRRWVFIPFVATFKKSDPDYDPLIKDKIFTERALSYLLNIALEGAKRLMNNKKFTEPETVKKAKEQYKVDNSNSLTWLNETDKDRNYILSKPAPELYSEFQDYCRISGIKNIPSTRSFNKEIQDFFGVSKIQLWQKKEDGSEDRTRPKKLFFIEKDCPTNEA